ncbi:MAG TPA: IPT/TIG domain-containing protein, partial [Verrucomicrobiae bacterium]
GSTYIEVIVPFLATIGPVTVSNNDGQTQTFGDFIAGPYISSFERLTPPPSSIDPNDKYRGNPGDTVFIQGLNFESNDGSSLHTTVYFGNVPAATETRGSQALVATVPASAVTGLITVYTTAYNRVGSNVTAQYFYIPPVITSFTGKAVVGGQINVTGTSLLGVTNVTIGGVTVPNFTIQGATGTNLLVTIPTNAPLSGVISVMSGGSRFATTASFSLLPSITGFSVPGAAVGDTITINGYGLAGATNVFFGGVAAVPSASTANSATVKVPDGALTGTVRISTTNGTYITSDPFYIAPAVKSFDPIQGIVGTQITVTGQNFSGATKVAFNGTVAPAFNVTGTNSLVVSVPSGASTGPISVTGPGGTGSSTATFIVLGPQPYVYTVSPASGGPGTVVRITGLNLGNVTAVSFNGTAAGFTLGNATNFTTQVPVGATTGPIIVSNPAGQGVSPINFVAGTNADLSLQMSVNPMSPVTDSDMTVNFTVRNQGPLPASAARATFTGTPAINIVDTSSTVGSSDIIGKTVQFSFGDLPAGSTVSGSVKLHVVTNASFTLSMNTTSDTPDPNSSNNAAHADLVSSGIALSISAATADSVHIAWPVVSANYILERALLLAPPAWSTVTNAPDTDGSQYFLNLPATNTAYYRLRKP